MDSYPLSILHRLPHYYRWSTVMPATLSRCDLMHLPSPDDLIIFELLPAEQQDPQYIMQSLQEMLADVDTDSQIIKWQDRICLLIASADEAAVNCCLKNKGIAITQIIMDR